jgi:histidyl-tRNA synthetase
MLAGSYYYLSMVECAATAAAPAGILSALSCSSLDDLEAALGEAGAPALEELRRLFALAEGYGYADWLAFDARVVRGLAYYTGE